MRIPFGGFFDRLFQSDRALGWKMLGGAAVIGFIAIVKVAGTDPRQLPFNRTPANFAWLGLNAAALGAGFVLVLSIRDDARRRQERGESLARLPRFLAGRGCLWSFLIAVALALTFVIIGFIENAKG